MFKKKEFKLFALLALVLVISPIDVQAMHIMEGYLPPMWALAWGVVCLPFLFLGFKRLNTIFSEQPKKKMIVALAGAFVFVLSAMKIPSVTGSCSHPTGVGLGAILFGPTIMSVLGGIVLLFQAVLLAHGGLTTLGANLFSMAIVGPIVAYFVFKGLNKAGASKGISVFFAAALADLATYVVTSIQLGIAYPDPTLGISGSLVKFLGIFAVTQIPLAIGEGLLTTIVYNLLNEYKDEYKEEFAGEGIFDEN